MQDLTALIIKYQIWFYPILVLIITLVLNRAIHWILQKRLAHFDATTRVWSHALLKSINAPLRAAVWLSAIIIIKQIFTSTTVDTQIQHIFRPLIGILFIAILTWFLLALTEQYKKNFVDSVNHYKKDVDYTAIDAITKLVWAFVLIFAIISALQQLNVPLASLLAFGGAAGIAVGFAAQTLVSNLFGGLTIYASRIFKIGDDIIIPGTNLAGTVQQIGWRATHVIGWDGKPFYVPNSLFNSSNMINHSRLKYRSMTEHLLLRYENYDKVRLVIEEGNALLKARNDLIYFVFRFDKFGDGALKLLLYAWIQPVPNGDFVPFAEYMRVKEDLLLAVADIALKHDCKLILPVSNVYLNQGHDNVPGPMAGLDFTNSPEIS